MQRTIWTVKNGRVLEIRQDNNVVKVDPVLDIAELQQAGCSLQDIDGYLNVRLALNGHASAMPIEASQVREAFAEPVEVIRPKRTMSEEHKQKIRAKLQERRGGTQDSYRRPDDVSCAYHFIPKEVPDMMYAVMEQNEITTPQGVYTSPNWKWHDSKGHKLMMAGTFGLWVARGVVKRIAKGEYEIAWPGERLREFAKRKGVDISPTMVREEFWVPERVARAWLERLEQEKYLKKHVRHDEWNLANMPEIAKPVRVAESTAEKHVDTSTAKVVQRPKYDPGEFKFKKGRIVCSECGHHFAHAYYRGQYKLCMNCYRTIVGGSTAHGKGATIAKG